MTSPSSTPLATGGSQQPTQSTEAISALLGAGGIEALSSALSPNQLPQIIYRTLASVDGLRGEISGLRSDLSSRLSALEQKMEAHVTYREFSANAQANKESIASLSERITAMEEWRIAEINRRTEQLQALQQQMGQVNTTVAQTETRTVSATSAHVIEINRTTLQYAMTIIGILISAFLAHAFWH